MRKIISIILLMIFSFPVFANLSPEGNWKTIDDKTGQPKSIVNISVDSNNLSGRVVKLFPGAMTVCTACNGKLKNQPIVGMTVMWNLKQKQNNPQEWIGGSIMDPKTGKVYSCKLQITPDGKKMIVRGYLGVSLLGRSQTWYRE